MKTYEATARTEQEAIEIGLRELGVSISDVEVSVLEEGSKGLFGLFGSRPTRVRLTVKDDVADPLGEIITDQPAEEEQPATAPRAEEKKEAQAAEKPVVAAAKPEEKPAEKKAPLAQPVQRTAPKAAPKAEPAAEKKATAEERPIVSALIKPEITWIAPDQLDPESAAGIAKAFLGELTKLMGVEVEIEVGNDAEGNVFGRMTGDPLGILIGRRGETLDAIQYLTSLKVNKGHEGYTRVSLDTENYRAKREDTLVRLANRYANRAIKTGRRVSLEPMNPYERRIIHSALQPNEAVDTHSEGEEPNRHVVITLKK